LERRGDETETMRERERERERDWQGNAIKEEKICGFGCSADSLKGLLLHTL
jgi:hypothetical protein